MIRVRTSTGTKAIKAVKVRRSGGVTKDVFAGSVRNASALKRFFSQSGTISITADPASTYGAIAIGFTATISTNTTTVTPTGGANPYTYAWTLITSDGGTWSIQNPTSATTKFTCAGVVPNSDQTATFRCTVTDNVGGTGTVDVEAFVANYGSLYP
jgi:hypothetical protein